MKYSYYFLLLLFCSSAAFSQSTVALDTTGKLVLASDIHRLKDGGKITINADFSKMKRKVVDLLINKLDTTIQNLENSPAYSYNRFYTTLWSDQTIKEIRDDMDAIKKFLTDGTIPAALKHMDPLYQAVKKFIDAVNAAPETWYSLNNMQVAGKEYSLKGSDFTKKKPKVTLEFRLNLLYNKMITELFKSLYDNNDMQALKLLPLHVYENEKKSLAQMVASLKPLSVYNYSNVNEDAIKELTQLRANFNNLEIVKAARSASLFRNFIWWRNADITFNPFEWRYRDTASNPKSDTIYNSARNVSLFRFYNQSDKKLNSVLLAQEQDNVRNISFFQNAETDDDLDDLKDPLKSTELVRVAVHNISSGDKAELRLVKSTAHNGMNNATNMLDSAFTVWGRGLTDANAANTGWGDLKKLLQGITKSVPTEFRKKFTSADSINAFRDTTRFWASFKKGLKEEGMFNPYAFDTTKRDTSLAGPVYRAIRSRDASAITKAIKLIINSYNLTYALYKNAIDNHYNDSLVITVIYRMISEGTRPTFVFSPRPDDGSFCYRTELMQTTPTDENVKQVFDVVRLTTVNGKTDTAPVGTFSYKSSAPQVFAVSIGPAFTIANSYYARNTVTSTAGDAPVVTSTREMVNFTFGLHIYPWKIFTLDNNLFHSPASPFYTRLSVYVGLGFPKTLKNFYPGISYDIIAGIRIIGGVHCFMYDRYKINNNIIVDQTSQFRAAGAFFSINIDPRIAIKAIGIIK